MKQPNTGQRNLGRGSAPGTVTSKNFMNTRRTLKDYFFLYFTYTQIIFINLEKVDQIRSFLRWSIGLCTPESETQVTQKYVQQSTYDIPATNLSSEQFHSPVYR